MTTKLYTFQEPLPCLPKNGGHVRIAAAVAERINPGDPEGSELKLYLHAVMLVNEAWYAPLCNQRMDIAANVVRSATDAAVPVTGFPPL